jgi:hypothetical protein
MAARSALALSQLRNELGCLKRTRLRKPLASFLLRSWKPQRTISGIRAPAWGPHPLPQ